MNEKNRFSEIYDEYVNEYLEGKLNFHDELFRLDRLIKQDIAIVNDRVREFLEWLSHECSLDEVQRVLISESLKYNVKQDYHLTNPLQFQFDILDPLQDALPPEMVNKDFFLSEPVKLIERICEKGKRLSQMRTQKRALSKLENKIQDEGITPYSEREKLIMEFADIFSSNPNFERKEAELREYLMAWINIAGHGRRKIAKDKAIEKTQSLSSVADGTLRNWEKKWENWLISRTGKMKD